MAWRDALFKRAAKRGLQGTEYRVPFTLYSRDGQREVEVRKFRDGETYLVECDWVAGKFEDRHSGAMVGPFASPKAAEDFIVGTSWFNEGAE